MLVVWSFTSKMFDFSPAKLLKFQIQLTSLSWPFAQPSVQITAKSRGHLKVSSRGFFECGTIPTFCRVVQLVRSKKKPLITLLYWFNTVIMEHLVDNVFYSHASIFQLTWQRFEGEFILCQEKKNGTAVPGNKRGGNDALKAVTVRRVLMLIGAWVKQALHMSGCIGVIWVTHFERMNKTSQ